MKNSQMTEQNIVLQTRIEISNNKLEVCKQHILKQTLINNQKIDEAKKKHENLQMEHWKLEDENKQLEQAHNAKIVLTEEELKELKSTHSEVKENFEDKINKLMK
jgi:PhoPQ-activated pathogenicity-related protein